ncbi:MAG: heterodisulfide reductase-related iron-sulfur binding cluster [Candidatus Thalassarchaeaceae archaeon]
MPIRFAYHPGNVAHSSAPEVDETMRAACRSLDIELVDMPGATSCGAGILGQANRRLQITLNARTMSIAEDLGLDIITPCATTAATLHEDLVMLKADPSLMGDVNRTLEKTTGRVLEGSIKIRHLLHVIVEDIGIENFSMKVKNPIPSPLGPYYGPNLQQDGLIGGDDVFDPWYMEGIIEAGGGKPVTYSSRTSSAGTPGIFAEEQTALRQSANILFDAKAMGAKMVISACTLAHGVLDIYQGKASRATGLNTNIPVIHFCEYVAFLTGNFPTRLAMLKTRVAVIGD